MTEEMLAKKAIKSKRRREQAQEKREEDKVFNFYSFLFLKLKNNN